MNCPADPNANAAGPVEIPNVQTAMITQPYEARPSPGAAATERADATRQLCQSGASCVATICA